jgi:hypothetical protein
LAFYVSKKLLIDHWALEKMMPGEHFSPDRIDSHCVSANARHLAPCADGGALPGWSRSKPIADPAHVLWPPLTHHKRFL